jgi:antitoxin (DNA-binding transcriptional repressor) of toxin-antitoxin stability system
MERHSSSLFRLILAAVASGFSLDAAIAAPPLDAYGNLPQVELMRIGHTVPFRYGCRPARLLQCATVRFMTIRTITQREIRNQSAAVLREVEVGRTIIASRNGTPVGELRPIKRRHFVPRAAIADAAGKAARIDATQFRADLDAVVDPRPYD